MTFNYAATAATAQRLLANFGRSLTHTYIAAEDSGISDDGDFTDNESTQTIVGADFDASAVKLGPEKEALVQHGDRIVYVGAKTSSGTALNPEPKPDDKLTLGSTRYRIAEIVERLAPAGTLVMMTVLVRK